MRLRRAVLVLICSAKVNEIGSFIIVQENGLFGMSGGSTVGPLSVLILSFR